MSQIKSALELALKKTEGIQGSQKKLLENERRQDGKRLLARFFQALQDGQDNETAGKALTASIKNYPREERKWVREGLVAVLGSNIVLPQDEESLANLQPVQLAAKAMGGGSSVDTMFQQLQQFFAQYLQEKQQVIENLRQQFAPRMQQQQEAYAQQTGQRVSLDPANDPEFQKYLQQAMEQLKAYYGQALHQLREDLSRQLA